MVRMDAYVGDLQYRSVISIWRRAMSAFFANAIAIVFSYNGTNFAKLLIADVRHWWHGRIMDSDIALAHAVEEEVVDVAKPGRSAR